MSSNEILELRKRHLGRGLSLSYRQPLNIVRGKGQYLYSDDGRQYLDCVNNVCHVGHCHPQVVKAATEQMSRLNTNTRYLHPSLSTYVQQLTGRFPDPLNVCYLVNSGSEAVDLALRLARTYTGSKALIALEAGYHGNTAATVAASHYKFAGPGGEGMGANTMTVPVPCHYRGRYRSYEDPLNLYVEHIGQCIEQLRSSGQKPAAFIAESMLSVAGQIILPNGYLSSAYEQVRAAGGVCIADEVQVGFGRSGDAFWAFELQKVIPDIVTLGKPMGNGHPMAAVITTEEISAAFDNGMEHFNTFGGNPVSCAVGLAVLEVIEQEQLQSHAKAVGRYLLTKLHNELTDYTLVGDIRGQGMFIGIEMVLDDDLTAATQQAYDLVNRMKELGVLLSVDGPLENVIKFKPPMIFTLDDADFLVENLHQVFKEA